MCWGSGVSLQGTTAGRGRSQIIQDADRLSERLWNVGGLLQGFFLSFLVVIQTQHDVTFEERTGNEDLNFHKHQTTLNPAIKIYDFDLFHYIITAKLKHYFVSNCVFGKEKAKF